MKTTFYFTTAFILISCLAICQIPTLNWVASMGGDGNDQITSTAIDEYGNLYSIGNFKNTVDFDPTDGESLITSNGGTDIFIQKMDSTGQLIWVKTIGGTSNENGYGIAIDSENNIYCTGSFNGSLDFDPGTETFMLSGSNGTIFILKLDQDGEFIWAKSAGGGSSDEGNDITIDKDNSVIVTGHYYGTADFDPGTGQFELSSQGITDIFILKLDSSGDFIWANSIGGTDFDFGYSVDTDSEGNIIVNAVFKGLVDVDPGTDPSEELWFESAGYLDNFLILKLDPSGDMLWARSTGERVLLERYNHAMDIDDDDNIYITGSFFGTADLDFGPLTNNIEVQSGNATFIQKLDANGDFVWVKAIDGSDIERGTCLSLGSNGDIFVAGEYETNAEFIFNTENIELNSVGEEDVFILKLDTSGDFIWVTSIGGTSEDNAVKIVTDNLGVPYLVGDYNGTADFDPESTINNNTSNGGTDMYILKLGERPSSSIIKSDSRTFEVKLSPNPTRKQVQVFFEDEIDGQLSLILYTISGKLISTKKIHSPQQKITLNIDQPAGVYILEIRSSNNYWKKKIQVY